jgi:hypothetical protein
MTNSIYWTVYLPFFIGCAKKLIKSTASISLMKMAIREREIEVKKKGSNNGYGLTFTLRPNAIVMRGTDWSGLIGEKITIMITLIKNGNKVLGTFMYGIA